ncbi:alpha-ketoacid dehydrogenase subunit alpha/beta [Aurantibacillus circumpalustris]|uniref:alpha-ketoacid dehydrogenase subunit alpha/beta n=1 Tax=Aurantibacillus circumpalustris TaxID=3036359 RepID=UPI00295B06FA|nr:dehydrogenase E1 component subunit alpha/beta [Aurantibacillus circumpalustris]
MITAETPVKFEKKKHKDSTLLELYTNILKPRMIEEKMLLLLRQGKIAKWFSGIGQEAISVGVATALNSDEYILPMHRNLGVFTTRKIPLNRLFSQFQGKPGGFTQGRDRSFHFGTNEYHIVGMISHLGPQLGVADGIALANKIRREKKVTVVFSGDGGASEGDFHESINTAAVWNLPVIFVIENNGYGLSTPSNEQFRCSSFADKAIGYGIEGVSIDGNNVLKVYETIKTLSESIRNDPRPVILECVTFRMRGHEEASGTKYVPKELFDVWGRKDPVATFEKFLLDEGVLTEELIANTRTEIKKEIDEGLEIAFAEKNPTPDTAKELKELFKDFSVEDTSSVSESKTNMRLIDAISNGMKLAMQKHKNLVLMGQDIADYGGVFKITEGFVEAFGKERVRNTPLCESAILGAGFGLSINGHKAMVEMQFADFVSEGMTQIVNNLAKSYYRWGQNADVVVRMPTGAAVAAGPFHSQSNEAWFFKTPGLKIAYPAFPSDAKGLLLTAFDDPNPVMYFEHKALYRSIAEDVPDGYYTIPFGKAKLLKEGNDLTIVTYGLGVHWALEALTENNDMSADLLDLRTLAPLDIEAVYASVKKTGKVIVMHEDTLTGGIAGEIASLISENCFDYLDAPVMREGSLDTPVPMNVDLEHNFLPKERFKEKLLKLWKY